jgi:hypothetical protein
VRGKKRTVAPLVNFASLEDQLPTILSVWKTIFHEHLDLPGTNAEIGHELVRFEKRQAIMTGLDFMYQAI